MNEGLVVVAIGSAYWGRGLFVAAAEAALDFAFVTLRIARLEARASIKNGRGNGALRKLGAVAEAMLRRSFLRHGQYHDQMLWTILASERAWHSKAVWGSRVH